jgi:hypothetical protein
MLAKILRQQQEIDVLKKGLGHLRETGKVTVREMFEFIAENENEFNVSIATSAFGISRATFYRYKNKQPTQMEVRCEEIRKQVLEIYKSSEGRYGAPKILKVLNN